MIEACRQYSAENPEGYYPQIDPKPGRLIMAKDPAYDDLLKNGDENAVYLGYAVCFPQNADLYADMYRDFAGGKFAPNQDYVKLGTGQTLKRLKASVEIYCSANQRDPKSNAEAAAAIPVIIERRDNYKDKRAPVAFFDGHVEWLAPGQNEVVDAIHNVLPQLDAYEK